MCYSSKFKYTSPYYYNPTIPQHTHVDFTDHQILKEQLTSQNIPHDVFLDNLRTKDIVQVEYYEDQLIYQINSKSELPPPTFVVRNKEPEEQEHLLPSYEESSELSIEYNDEKKKGGILSSFFSSSSDKESKLELPLPVTTSNNSKNFQQLEEVRKRRRFLISLLILLVFFVNVGSIRSGCMMGSSSTTETDQLVGMKDELKSDFEKNYNQALDFNF